MIHKECDLVLVSNDPFIWTIKWGLTSYEIFYGIIADRYVMNIADPMTIIR